ncbi:hypothetical protein ACFL06_00815 [Patescibacteria group bacterium]
MFRIPSSVLIAIFVVVAAVTGAFIIGISAPRDEDSSEASSTTPVHATTTPTHIIFVGPLFHFRTEDGFTTFSSMDEVNQEVRPYCFDEIRDAQFVVDVGLPRDVVAVLAISWENIGNGPNEGDVIRSLYPRSGTLEDGFGVDWEQGTVYEFNQGDVVLALSPYTFVSELLKVNVFTPREELEQLGQVLYDWRDHFGEHGLKRDFLVIQENDPEWEVKGICPGGFYE